MAPWVWPVILGWALGLLSSLLTVLVGSKLADKRKRHLLETSLKAELPAIVAVLSVIASAYETDPTRQTDYARILILTEAARKGFDYYRPNLGALSDDLHHRVFLFYSMLESLALVHKDHPDLIEEWGQKFNDLLEQGRYILGMLDK